MTTLEKRAIFYGPENPFPGACESDPDRLLTPIELHDLITHISAQDHRRQISEVALEDYKTEPLPSQEPLSRKDLVVDFLTGKLIRLITGGKSGVYEEMGKITDEDFVMRYSTLLYLTALKGRLDSGKWPHDSDLKPAYIASLISKAEVRKGVLDG